MSSSETIYTPRLAYPDYLERGRAQRVDFPLYRDGSLVTPTEGTFTLYDTGTGELVTGDVTIANSIAYYDLTAANLPSTLGLGRYYREAWQLTLPDGTERTYRRDAVLCVFAPHPTLTDADVDGVYRDLSRHRRATDTTWQPYRDEAFRRIIGRLENLGVFPEHIVTDWSQRELEFELTLYLIGDDFAKSAGGRWGEFRDAHKREFELAWRRLRYVRSTGENGNADSSDLRAANPGVTFVNRSPCKTWGGGFGL